MNETEYTSVYNLYNVRVLFGEKVTDNTNLHKFHGDQLETLLFKSFDDVGDQRSVDGVWLDHQKCSLFVVGHREKRTKLSDNDSVLYRVNRDKSRKAFRIDCKTTWTTI